MNQVAFYDLDGTLISSNVVTRYAWFAKHHPSKPAAVWRYSKTLLGVPLWLALDAYSRRTFNVVFYRQYRGLDAEWLRAGSEDMFESDIVPKIFRHARELVESDKAAGFRVVMVTGGIDFAVAPAARHFGFDDVIANRLEFRQGVATGDVIEPMLAESAKVDAMRRYCAQHGFAMSEAKAYSDSGSDIPMLEAVGHPAAANPDKKLLRRAQASEWLTYDLRRQATPLKS